MLKYIISLLALLLLVSAYWLLRGESPRPENSIVRGVHYVGVSVSDLEQSRKLFAESFDVKTVQDGVINNEAVMDSLIGSKDLSITTRLMRSSNMQLRLMQFNNPSERAKNTPHVNVHGPGIAHVCVQVVKETDAYGKFLAGGATPIGAHELVRLNPRNPVYYAYARDRDNIMFEIEHVDVAELNLDTPPKNDYRIRHVALASPDIDRLVKFYSVLLEQKNPRRLGRLVAMSGEKFDQVSGLPDTKLKMAFFQVRNMELEIAQYLSHPTKTPAKPRPVDALGYNMIVFDVVDMAAVREKLLKAGGTVVTEPDAMDGGQIMFARDPDGNLLGFQVLDKSSPLSAQNFKDNGI